MWRSFRHLFGFCAIFTLCSCGQDSRITSLETKIKTLETEVKDLKAQVSFDEMAKNWDGVAYMTPGAEGYSVIRSDLGPLTVSLANIESYANGSRVTLQFGNLTSATIDGLKAKVEWGSVDKNGVPNNEQAKSRNVSFTESLSSGSWTKSAIVLDGIPPAELGFVRLSEVSHSGIHLRKPFGG